MAERQSETAAAGRRGGSSAAASPDGWGAWRLFALLRELGPLRVISRCGPSTFEAICTVGDFDVSGGFVNAITPAYHWHFEVRGLGHLRSRDEVHARSGRRVLFFELREDPGDAPFLRIYLYRGKREEFGTAREAAFAAAHAELASGVACGR
jgi:hypothetical protein